MQRLKLTVAGCLIPLCVGMALAAPTTAMPSPDQPNSQTSVSKVIDNLSLASTQPEIKPVSDAADMQTHIKEMVEQDYSYEKARRELKNELEMEKMRSEIRKLRGEGKNKPVAAAQPVAPKSGDTAQPAQKSMPAPRVVLDSQIGGLSRVAVVAGEHLMYITPGEVFEVDGYHFKLGADRKSVLCVEGAAK